MNNHLEKNTFYKANFFKSTLRELQNEHLLQSPFSLSKLSQMTSEFFTEIIPSNPLK